MTEKISDWQQPHDLLLAHYGRQDWWPGDTPFEVMVGAVLTQNTSWTNVERAIARLKSADALSPRTLVALAPEVLAELIRPAGYFNVKTRRLQALCQFLFEAGVADAPHQLGRQDTLEALRTRLLGVHGVGEETADSILLYALERPSFVIDAYTRRLFSRLGLITGDEPYAVLRERFQNTLPRDTALFNEYHALIVQLGKSTCRPKPRCSECPLLSHCPTGNPA